MSSQKGLSYKESRGLKSLPPKAAAFLQQADALSTWFGNSKVVNPDGTPKIVFHGTEVSSLIDVFGGNSFAGWFAEDSDKAADYALARDANDFEVDAVIYPVYLSIKNPLDLTLFDLNDPFNATKLAAAINKKQAKFTNAREVQYFYEENCTSKLMWGIVATRSFQEWVDALGCDGVKALEGGHVTWAALNSNQIKSAVGNSGKFDFSKPSITAKVAVDITRTPAFKAWFGDWELNKNSASKVVDKQGKPQVMYHATQNDIDVFRPYTHFGTQDAANDRDKSLRDFFDHIGNPTRGAGANVVPVYLSITNPLRLPDLASIDDPTGEPFANYPELPEGTPEEELYEEEHYVRAWEGEDTIITTLRERGIIDIDEFWEYQYKGNDAAFKLLAEKGYDGIVYTNTVEDAGQDSWIVFNSNQVKSAIGSKFDINNTSITGSTEVKPNKAILKQIEKEFKGLREAEGEGQCATMAEILQMKFGWKIDAGFYLKSDAPGHAGHGDHVWNVLKDGTIVDGTHDQFGGPNVAVIPPTSPEYHKYHAYCGSFDCPHCTCNICNQGFSEEAKSKTSAKIGGSGWLLRDGTYVQCGRGKQRESHAELAVRLGLVDADDLNFTNADLELDADDDALETQDDITTQVLQQGHVRVIGNEFEADEDNSETKQLIADAIRQSGVSVVSLEFSHSVETYTRINKRGLSRQQALNWLEMGEENPEFNVQAAEQGGLKAWFGNSKVVNSDGSPKIVYHGTQSDFNEFLSENATELRGHNYMPKVKGGFFFSSKSSGVPESASRGEGGNIMPCYLSIKKPLYANNFSWGLPNAEELLIDNAKSAEHDGIIGTSREYKDETFYIVFNSNQIKSAIGNAGTYDSQQNSITAAEEPKKTRWEKMLEDPKDAWLGPAQQRELKEPWVEYVPISQLLPLKEWYWDKDNNRHGREEFEDLMEDMKRYGVREPITIRYFHDTKRAVIIEGNHRVAAAQEIGLKSVPARVTIASYPQKDYGHGSDGGSVRGRLTDEKPRKDYITPSEIGLGGSKTAALKVHKSGLPFGPKKMKFGYLPVEDGGNEIVTCECGNWFDINYGLLDDTPRFDLVDRFGAFNEGMDEDDENVFLHCLECDTIYERQTHDGKYLQQVIPTQQEGFDFTAAASTNLPATDENIQRAKDFLQQKWIERAQELGREVPTDLSGACKFASLFAQALFGGELQGNWNHQYVQLGDQIIDLTDGSNYEHDSEFWGNPEHTESMNSCKPRVDQWVQEFNRTKKTAGVYDKNEDGTDLTKENIFVGLRVHHKRDSSLTGEIVELKLDGGGHPNGRVIVKWDNRPLNEFKKSNPEFKIERFYEHAMLFLQADQPIIEFPKEAKTARLAIYHCAPTSERTSIQKNGIQSELFNKGRSTSGKGFYAFKNVEEARWYAADQAETEPSEPFDVWEIIPPAEAFFEPDEDLLVGSDEPNTALYCDTPAAADSVKLVATYTPGKDWDKTASFSIIALNIPRLVKDFGQKIVERYQVEKQLPTGTVTLPEHIIEYIKSFDPTANFEYTAWLVGNYARGDINTLEEIRVDYAPMLQRFHDLKMGRFLQPDEKDINKFKGSSLMEVIENYTGVKTISNRKKDAEKEKAFFTSGDAELFYNDAELKIVIPKTEEASKWFGINTRWCTAATEGHNHFPNYQKGPLYIILVKAANERYQFYFPSAEFNDEQNYTIKFNEVFTAHPKIAELFVGIAQTAVDNGEAQCDDCDGTGKTDCNNCNGKGQFDCENCDGRGHTKCAECNGSGEWECGKCEGSGELPDEKCEECDGEGTFDNKECAACDGSGEADITCPECDGSGTINCDYCEEGQNECGSCGGEGSYFCEYCDEGKRECDECAGTGLKGDLAEFFQQAQKVSNNKAKAVSASFSITALNIPRLVKDFGTKIVERYRAENTARRYVSEEQAATYTAEKIIEYIKKSDPTPNFEYTAWMVGNYARNDIEGLKDLESEVAPLLARFHDLKKGNFLAPEDKDIGKIKGIAQLAPIIEKYGDVVAESNRQRAAKKEKQFFVNGDATLFYNDAKMKIVIPNTEETAKWFGVNTKWCTAAEENNYFDNYSSDHLYIVLLKAENLRYQFYFPTSEFHDETNHSIDIQYFLKAHPKIASLFVDIAQEVVDSGECQCDDCDGRGSTSCDHCDGEGNNECRNCEGSGNVQCEDCSGSGEIDCGTCEGSGVETIVDAEGNDQEINCVECDGQGHADCDNCDEGYVDCGPCDGHGEMGCEYCESGNIACRSCDGTGLEGDIADFLKYAKQYSKTASAKITKFMYHATYRPYLESIMAHGLGGKEVEKNWEDSRIGIIYLAPDASVAESYAETSDIVPEEWLDQIVVLKIDVSKLDQTKLVPDPAPNMEESETYCYSGIIPPDAIVSKNKKTAKICQWEKAGIPEDVFETYDYGGCMYLAMALNKRFGWPIKVGYEGNAGEKYIVHAWVEAPDGRELDIAGWDGPGDYVGRFVPELTERFIDWQELAERFDTDTTPARIADAEKIVDQYIIPGYLNVTPKTANKADDFETWFSGSQVVDEQGKPLKVYHGTARNKPEWGNWGAYFTADPHSASECAITDATVENGSPYVLPAYLSIKNPKTLSSPESNDVNIGTALQDLKNEGYDGVFGTHEGKIVEYVAFYPNKQIRPAFGKTATNEEINLKDYLENLRGVFVEIAQEVYDFWDDGKWAGLCRTICSEIVEEVLLNKPSLKGGEVNDGEHAWAVITNDNDAFKIDIPWKYYERRRRKGEGVGWKRLKNIEFNESMIVIEPTIMPTNWDKTSALKLKLYHGSEKKFAPGMLLTPQTDGYTSKADKMIQQTERILEAARPEGALPRPQSVYMVADPDEIDFAGGYDDYIYEVEPIGEVEKNDMDWYSAVGIYMWDDENDPEAISYAQGYWSGKAKSSTGTLFEYRAPQAKIIRLVSPTEKTSAENPSRVYTANEVAAHLAKYWHEQDGNNTAERFKPQLDGIEFFELRKMRLKNIPDINKEGCANVPLAAEYAKLETEFPPIILGHDMEVIDGWHRCTAALMRGDRTIMAFVPVIGKFDSNNPSVTASKHDEVSHSTLVPEWNRPEVENGNPKFNVREYEKTRREAHPDFLYHSIARKHRQYILKTGLNPDCYDSGAVFFRSTCPPDLTDDGMWDTWKINVKGLDLTPDNTTPLAPNEHEEFGAPWWSCDNTTPPDRLELLTPYPETEPPAPGRNVFEDYDAKKTASMTLVYPTDKTAERNDLYYDDPEDNGEDELGFNWLHGHCHIYTVALHNLTGYPCFLINDGEVEGLDMHSCVRAPNKKFLDASGYVTLKRMQDRYGLIKPFAQPADVEAVSRLGLLDDDELNHATEVAKVQLAKLGIQEKTASEGSIGLTAEDVFVGMRVRHRSDRQLVGKIKKIVTEDDGVDTVLVRWDQLDNLPHWVPKKTLTTKQWIHSLEPEFPQFNFIASGPDYKQAARYKGLTEETAIKGMRVRHSEIPQLVGKIIKLTEVVSGLIDSAFVKWDKGLASYPKWVDKSLISQVWLYSLEPENHQLEKNQPNLQFGATMLYHGTSQIAYDEIMANGGIMTSPSWWGTEAVAEYYAEVATESDNENANVEEEDDFGGEEKIIALPISAFNQTQLVPDDNSIAEPLTYTLDRNEEDLYADWEACEGTWQDSLRIYGSVRYNAPINIINAKVASAKTARGGIGIEPDFNRGDRVYDLLQKVVHWCDETREFSGTITKARTDDSMGTVSRVAVEWDNGVKDVVTGWSLELLPDKQMMLFSSDKVGSMDNIFPTFDELMDASTDINNEFDFEEDEDAYEEILKFWQAQQFPVTLYRAIALNENKKINYKSIGICWSLEEAAAREVAYELFPNYDEYSVLQGTVTAEAINWLDTFRCWMTLPSEKEMRLKEGAKIQLVAPIKRMATT